MPDFRPVGGMPLPRAHLVGSQRADRPIGGIPNIFTKWQWNIKIKANFHKLCANFLNLSRRFRSVLILKISNIAFGGWTPDLANFSKISSKIDIKLQFEQIFVIIIKCSKKFREVLAKIRPKTLKNIQIKNFVGNERRNAWPWRIFMNLHFPYCCLNISGFYGILLPIPFQSDSHCRKWEIFKNWQTRNFKEMLKRINL